MSEAKSDWNLFLSWKEFAQHLNTSSIIEVSLTCKYLRTKLKSKIFKRANINKLVESVAQGPGNEDTYIKKTQLIDSKYSSIKNYVTNLSFDVQSNPFYIQVVCEYFLNLSNLTINECIIPSTVLKNVFTNITALTNLSLNDNLILFRRGANHIEEINLPQSLKALELGDISAISTPYWEDPLLFFQTWTDLTQDTVQLKLKFSSLLPNLVYLHLMTIEGVLENNLSVFLVNNNQLKFIKVYLDCLTPLIFESLAKCKQMVEVEILPPIRSNLVTVTQNNITLTSVKKLTLNNVVNRDAYLLSCIILPFINITELKISNIYSWPHHIYIPIQNFKNLEKLTIYKTTIPLKLNNFFLASRSLKVLEFIGFDKLGFKLNLTANCPKIRLVSFDTSNFNAGSLAELLEVLGRYSSKWTILKFMEAVKCYKK
ncbi:hypothetical protein CONCODRAFT_13463 [Conidiobolus coronatus NRRL 28638]|uniref:F-box domain-containing protein n=1 Tax=Conidiobolus coronatus (strain ATCC 28846 / CBS 209.66 / NRRL 28638) TaxID=796925 RepID=A0A137NQT1_CONC2|nr:hypothetical protein CONCODRAFT_13463 [Conidiobolus coronatus NRRL 28638]|eukprot:KXN65078.1 hypothetical protein CONCODRAFT_13463 [Conidiobolus coronatus NRRL 28638]